MSKSELQKRLDEAIDHRNSGRVPEAIAILKELRSRFPQSASVHGYLGGIYLDAEHYTAAAEAFRTAVALSPKSELASLGLFHSLFHRNEIDDAFAEMRRFLAISKSSEYERLLEELNGEDDAAPRVKELAAGVTR